MEIHACLCLFINKNEILCYISDYRHTIPGFSLLGHDINLNGKENIQKSILDTLEMYDTIGPLQIALSPFQSQKGSLLIYVVEDLTSAEENKTTDHHVTCIGHRPPFSIRQRILFRVSVSLIYFSTLIIRLHSENPENIMWNVNYEYKSAHCISKNKLRINLACTLDPQNFELIKYAYCSSL